MTTTQPKPLDHDRIRAEFNLPDQATVTHMGYTWTTIIGDREQGKQTVRVHFEQMTDEDGVSHRFMVARYSSSGEQIAIDTDSLWQPLVGLGILRFFVEQEGF